MHPSILPQPPAFPFTHILTPSTLPPTCPPHGAFPIHPILPQYIHPPALKATRPLIPLILLPTFSHLLPLMPPQVLPHTSAPNTGVVPCPLTIGVIASALAHGVAMPDVLPPASPERRQEVTWGTSLGPPALPQIPTSWRMLSSGCRPCHPRHSMGRGPGSSQHRLLHIHHTGAGPGGSLLRPRTRKAVAVGATERTG